MGALPKIIETGVIANDKPVSGFGEFPFNYFLSAESIADRVFDLFKVKHNTKPIDSIVIEEINRPGRFTSRYSQKILDSIHCLLLRLLFQEAKTVMVFYINTSDWRKTVGANLTKADKALNIKIGKIKKKGDKKALKALGVRGKVTKKHVAVRFVNQAFGLELKAKDDDIADAISQGCAYFLGSKLCDGKW